MSSVISDSAEEVQPLSVHITLMWELSIDKDQLGLSGSQSDSLVEFQTLWKQELSCLLQITPKETATRALIRICPGLLYAITRSVISTISWIDGTDGYFRQSWSEEEWATDDNQSHLAHWVTENWCGFPWAQGQVQPL